MKKYQVEITADTNDGDYINSINTINPQDMSLLQEMAKAIKEFKSYEIDGWTHYHNYPEGECLRSDLGEKSVDELYSHVSKESRDFFDKLIPFEEYGIHTIVSIKVKEIHEEIKLL